MENSYLVRQERCPACAKQGKDRGANNLAVYSDGHEYCFSCGHYVSGSGISRLKSRVSQEPVTKHEVVLPSDSDVCYPTRALEWVGHYDLTRNDLLNNNVLWSETNQRLIFPVYGDNGLIAYQGRYFGQPAPEGSKPFPKWWGVGDLSNTFHILGKSSTQLVLVEDVVSAIKLSKFTMAMPLFGSHVGITRFKRLRSLLVPSTEVCLYLDPDKRKESVVEARRGQLVGLNMRVIYSERDPKEESYARLKILLGCTLL